MAVKTKHLQIPQTRSADIQQQKFNEAVRQQLNMLGGTKLDRAITVRDVTGGILKGIKLAGAIIDQAAQPGSGGADADAPTVPTNVQGFAGVNVTFLTWDRPTFRGYAYTEIYRFDADNLALAVRVATSAQPAYSEYVGYGQTLYYWVRHVSTAGSNSAFHATSGLMLQTKPDYEAIQDALSEQINESYLSAALRARIDLIDLSNGGGLVAGQQALRDDLDAYNQTLTSQGSAITQLQNTDATQATQISALGTRTTAAESQIVTIQQTKADSATVTTQIATAKGEAIAAAEDTARTYTDTKTGEIKAERTIKVGANDIVAGIGLIAGATTGSAIYFSADTIAIVPPGATTVTGARLPFIYDSATGAIMMDTTFIRDLTASQIAGGVLNLTQGNIRNLTVFESFSPPDQFLLKTHISDSLARELAWVDPNAVATGGSKSKTVSAALATTAVGDILSGGLAPTIKISGDGPEYWVPSDVNGYIDVQVLRNGAPVSVDGVSIFRLTVFSGLMTDEGLPPSQHRYAMGVSGGVDGVASAVASNTTTSWSIKILATSGIAGYSNDFKIKLTVFEAYSSTGGLVANTTWSAIADKPETATRWPSWTEITGTASSLTAADSSITLNLTPSTGLDINVASVTGGWARGFVPSNNGTRLAGAGFYGSGATVGSYHIGFGSSWWGTSAFEINPNDTYIRTTLRTNGAVRSGTAHQAAMLASSTAGEYVFGGYSSAGSNALNPYIRIGNNKLEYTNTSGAHAIHHAGERLFNQYGYAIGTTYGDNFDNSFEVYSGPSGVKYGMMLWNSNAGSGDYALMLYGSNQSNRRISFGKVNSTNPTNYSHVTEGAHFDLDDWSFNVTGWVKAPTSRGLNIGSSYITGGGLNSIRLTTPSGYVDIGPMNASYTHFQTDRPAFYMDKTLHVDGSLFIYGTGYGISSLGVVYGSRVYAGFDAEVENAISCSNWFRSSGTTGWFNSTYGGGIYMTDTSWIRVYGNKKFYVENTGTDAINTAGGVRGNYLGVANTSNSTGYGLSLYGGPVAGMPTYGMMFAGVSTFGTHGYVDKDWATYLTMNADTRRGWIFKAGAGSAGNVASISGAGHATFNGVVKAADFDYSSDTRLKKEQRVIKDALAKVKRLTGKTYYRTDINEYSAGIIAQALQAVLPEGVKEKDGYLSVSPSALIGLLVEAVKELAVKVERLEAA